MVVGRQTEAPLGIVSLYNPNMESGVAFLSVAALPQASHTGLVMEGAGLFIDYCFRSWNLRKIMIDAVSVNLEQYGSIAIDLFEEEGRLKDAEYYDGRYWDRVFLTLNRSKWHERRHALMPFLTGEERGV